MKSRRTYGLLMIVASLGVFPMGCCWCHPWHHHCCYPAQEQPLPPAVATSPMVTGPVQTGNEVVVSIGK
jgi:hypothetical protein